MGDRVNAMRDYTAALELDPTFALAYFNAGNISFHTRHFSQVGWQEWFIVNEEMFIVISIFYYSSYRN